MRKELILDLLKAKATLNALFDSAIVAALDEAEISVEDLIESKAILNALVDASIVAIGRDNNNSVDVNAILDFLEEG